MKLVLHFGAHKTGTSLIQKYLRDNRELMHRNKVWFTLRSETNKFLGWGKPEEVRRGVPALKREIDRAAARGARWFVVSHENALGRPFVSHKPGLYPKAPAAAAELADLLRDYTPVSVYYVRSQDEFVESYYLQTVHQGAYLTFRDWRKSVDFKRISWAPVIRALTDAFGQGNSLVKDFSTEVAKGQSGYLSSFFGSFMGSEMSLANFGHFAYGEVRNPSIGMKGLAIALAANVYLSTHRERKLMRVFLQDHFSNKDYPRPVLLKLEQKSRLRNRYQRENEALLTD